MFGVPLSKIVLTMIYLELILPENEELLKYTD